jgi:hypothetical protein
MADHDGNIIQIATERFERRLAEECGSLRVDMATEFGKVRGEMAAELGKVRVDMATEFGKVRAEMEQGFGGIRVELHQALGGLRAEMADRNAELLKWALVFGATQTAAIAGVVALLR